MGMWLGIDMRLDMRHGAKYEARCEGWTIWGGVRYRAGQRTETAVAWAFIKILIGEKCMCLSLAPSCNHIAMSIPLPPVSNPMLSPYFEP